MSRNIRFTSLLLCQTLCYANLLNTFSVQSFQKLSFYCNFSLIDEISRQLGVSKDKISEYFQEDFCVAIY